MTADGALASLVIEALDAGLEDLEVTEDGLCYDTGAPAAAEDDDASTEKVPQGAILRFQEAVPFF